MPPSRSRNQTAPSLDTMSGRMKYATSIPGAGKPLKHIPNKSKKSSCNRNFLAETKTSNEPMSIIISPASIEAIPLLKPIGSIPEASPAIQAAPFGESKFVLVSSFATQTSLTASQPKLDNGKKTVKRSKSTSNRIKTSNLSGKLSDNKSEKTGVSKSGTTAGKVEKRRPQPPSSRTVTRIKRELCTVDDLGAELASVKIVGTETGVNVDDIMDSLCGAVAGLDVGRKWVKKVHSKAKPVGKVSGSRVEKDKSVHMTTTDMKTIRSLMVGQGRPRENKVDLMKKTDKSSNRIKRKKPASTKPKKIVEDDEPEVLTKEEENKMLAFAAYEKIKEDGIGLNLTADIDAALAVIRDAGVLAGQGDLNGAAALLARFAKECAAPSVAADSG